MQPTDLLNRAVRVQVPVDPRIIYRSGYVFTFVHSTYKKGELAQLKVQMRALELDVLVSKPTIEARYDLVLDFGTHLERAQIKYAGCVVTPGAVQLDLRKQTRNKGVSRPYLSSEIDYLYVYIQPIDKIVKLSPAHFHNKKHLSLRWHLPVKYGRKDALLIDSFIW